MYFVSPKQQERYYQRLLLLHVRGAQTFSDLRTFDGITYDTYKETAMARDLVALDNEWSKCLEEGATFKFPKQMCELFAYILIFHQPPNAPTLYEKYKEHFMQDNIPQEQAEATCLKTINDILLMHKCDLAEFGLPLFDMANVIDIQTGESKTVDVNQLENSLNFNQKKTYKAIMKSISEANSNKLFFIDGPGGSGKSYLHNIIKDVLHHRGIKVLPIAWTGIAAILLKGGQTAHTAFRLPLNLNQTTTCGIKSNSAYAKTIKETKVTTS